MVGLTKKQRQVYKFIVNFTEEHGCAPTVREIGAALGLKSVSTVHFHLRALVEANLVSDGDGKFRGYALLPQEEEFAVPEENVPAQNWIPLLGNVAAGTPILAESNIEGYIPYTPRNGKTEEHFALHVKGDSMVDAGILDGDIVIVRRQPIADSGEIVIALLDGEATCKRLKIERWGKRIWLMPENEHYAPIDGNNAQIAGKVVGLIRNYT